MEIERKEKERREDKKREVLSDKIEENLSVEKEKNPSEEGKNKGREIEFEGIEYEKNIEGEFENMKNEWSVKEKCKSEIVRRYLGDRDREA